MNTDKEKILIVDDDDDVLLSAKMFLEEHFLEVITTSTPHTIPELLKKNDFGAILLDMNFRKGKDDGMEGLFWLQKIKDDYPENVVLLLTAFGEIDLAVDAIKQGAFDFILKPWQNGKLLGSVISACKHKQTLINSKQNQHAKEALGDALDKEHQLIIGKEDNLKKTLGEVVKIAPTDADVLILGENGTGKELIAREIHRQSKRQNNVFISVDMGSIHENLFESELFGHAKGAFTDAKENKTGRFEAAQGGTLFLDEIGNLPLHLQVKLLRVLEERKITAVGSSRESNIDIRLIAASNEDLKEKTEKGTFREDLYYRLNTFEIHIPPLRKRVDDIPLLADHYLRIFKNKYNKPHLQLSEQALKKMQAYHWPGNVRELKNAVERAVVLSETNKLMLNHIWPRKNRMANQLRGKKNLNLEFNEKKLILEALEKYGGNITKASAELGITRNALYRRMKKHDIQ